MNIEIVVNNKYVEKELLSTEEGVEEVPDMLSILTDIVFKKQYFQDQKRKTVKKRHSSQREIAFQVNGEEVQRKCHTG